MASAAGSDIFAIVALLCISLFVLLIIRHFLPLRSSPAYLVLPVFLSLALPASIILLVPIDLASSARVQDEGSKGIWLPERAVLVTWRIAYWLTFTLTWLAA
jgi:LMBR1-like membrane protein